MTNTIRTVEEFYKDSGISVYERSSKETFLKDFKELLKYFKDVTNTLHKRKFISYVKGAIFFKNPYGNVCISENEEGNVHITKSLSENCYNVAMDEVDNYYKTLYVIRIENITINDVMDMIMDMFIPKINDIDLPDRLEYVFDKFPSIKLDLFNKSCIIPKILFE